MPLNTLGNIAEKPITKNADTQTESNELKDQFTQTIVIPAASNELQTVSTQTLNPKSQSIKTQTNDPDPIATYSIETQTSMMMLHTASTQTTKKKCNAAQTQTNPIFINGDTQKMLQTVSDSIVSEFLPSISVKKNNALNTALTKALTEDDNASYTEKDGPEYLSEYEYELEQNDDAVQEQQYDDDDDNSAMLVLKLENTNDDDIEEYYYDKDYENEEGSDEIAEILPTNEYQNELTEIEYLEEENISDNSNVIYCEYCNVEFSSRQHLISHMQKECEQGLAPPKKRRKRNSVKKNEKFCSVCNLVLTANCTLESHMKFHKQTLPMIIDSGHFFRCGICLAVFGDSDTLQQHLLTDQNCYREIDKTNYVDYQFLEDQNFVGHTTPRLCSCTKSDEDNAIVCESCAQFTANSVDEILLHCIECHFSEDLDQQIFDILPEFEESLDTMHKCGICDKRFPTFKDAACHTYFHANKFHCPYDDCSDSYSKFFLLNQHLERNHVEGKEYQCAHCSEVLHTYYDYRDHLKNVCTFRLFPCTMCGKYFFLFAF